MRLEDGTEGEVKYVWESVKNNRFLKIEFYCKYNCIVCFSGFCQTLSFRKLLFIQNERGLSIILLGVNKL